MTGTGGNPSSSLEGVGLTLDYVRLNADGTQTDLGATAPTMASNYKVTASFAGSTDYTAGSASTTFSIAQAQPIFALSDSGGTFNGSPFAATATVAGVVAGVDNSPAATLEGVGLTLDYQQLDSNGNVVKDFGTTAPTAAGTYKVTASFAGSADYAAGTPS